ncbi:MAG: TauD/TfdA family dioxygenase [Hyphomicrobiaceae bacterium]
MTSTISTRPLSEHFGVEVLGLDLARMTRAHLYAEVRTLFEEHSALLFRGQSITREDHIRIAELFGPIEDRSADERRPGEAFEIPQVSNVLADGSVSAEMDLHTLNLKSNQLWHTDSTFLPVPALANLLIARVVTTRGGETELASTRAAWRDMPETLKARIRNRIIWHRYSHSRARISPELATLPKFNKWPDRPWPAIWTNPVNGAPALYIASHSFKVSGLSAEESAALIDELVGFCTQSEYVYSHAWQPGDVLIWDERATLHRGMPWPYDQPRTLSSICVSVTAADGLDDMLARAAA